MTGKVKDPVEELGDSSDAAERSVSTELLGNCPHLDCSEISEGELTSAADALFLDYDTRESAE